VRSRRPDGRRVGALCLVTAIALAQQPQRDRDPVADHARTLGKGKAPPRRDVPRSPQHDDSLDSVIELTAASLGDSSVTHPLLFVLFYSNEKPHGTFLHSNFSAAAVAVREMRIDVRLARMEVRKDWPETMAIARRLQISELPDIKIFRYGRPAEYQAGAGLHDLVDVARWNAGNLILPGGARPRASSVHDVEATSGLEVLLSKHRLVLLAFTTRWCSRCLMLQTEFDEASQLLAAAEPPVALAAVNLDNPLNWPLVERFGVLSFPVGKIFHRGRLVGDFMGGTLSHEIVAEMIKVRDELRLAEKVVEADAAVSAAASADGGAKDEL